MTIAESLKRFRKKFGYTMQKVAEKTGILRQAYNRYERAENATSPNAEYILKIATTFQVSADYLLGLTDDPTPHWKKIETAAPVEEELTLENLKAQLDRQQAEIDALKAKIAAL